MAANPLDGLIRSTESIAADIDKSRSQAAVAGAKAVRAELLAAAKTAGRARFRGGKLAVFVKATGANQANGTAGRSAGAWAIAEDGTKPHRISPRRARALAFGNAVDDGEVRDRPVDHPGTAGKNVWTTGLEAGQAAADVAVEAVLDEAAERGFRRG